MKKFQDQLFRFGENLRKLRTYRGLSREQLAEHLNTSPRTYQKYEKGQAEMPLGKILLTAEKLNVSVDSLFNLPQIDTMNGSGH